MQQYFLFRVQVFVFMLLLTVCADIWTVSKDDISCNMCRSSFSSLGFITQNAQLKWKGFTQITFSEDSFHGPLSPSQNIAHGGRTCQNRDVWPLSGPRIFPSPQKEPLEPISTPSPSPLAQPWQPLISFLCTPFYLRVHHCGHQILSKETCSSASWAGYTGLEKAPGNE